MLLSAKYCRMTSLCCPFKGRGAKMSFAGCESGRAHGNELIKVGCADIGTRRCQGRYELWLIDATANG